MIYTKPSDGVLYGTDIRGDRQEKAIEMTERVTADVMRRRELKKMQDKEQREKEERKGPQDEQNSSENAVTKTE